MGWRFGLAAAVIALLGLLPREGGIYHQAKTELAQSLREAAWKRAVAGDRNEEAWPWDGVATTATITVPRLGLSAAVNYDFGGQDSARNRDSARNAAFGVKRGNKADNAHDPHLARGDVAIGDRVTVITADGSTQVYTVTGREAGAAGQAQASPETSLSKDSCPQLNPSLAGALRLIIEAIRDAPSLEGAGEEQKL